MNKIRVYEVISGPCGSGYVCTCKTLDAAMKAIHKRANAYSPHNLVKVSETKFVSVPVAHPNWKDAVYRLEYV